MEHPRVRSENTAAAWKREHSRRDGRPWQPDPLGFKGTGLPHHRGAGVSDRVATIDSVTPYGAVSLDRILPEIKRCQGGFKILVQHRYPGRTRNQGVAHGPVSV